MKKSIVVQNLKCGGCANTISSKVSQMEGIFNVSVDVAKSEVTVEYEKDGLMSELMNTLASIGYPPVGERNSILSQAKSVVSCATGKLR